MKIRACHLVALMFCCSYGAFAQSDAQQKWAQIESSFLFDWQQLQIQSWPWDYKEFFRELPAQAAARKKDSVLGHYIDLMDKIQRSELSNGHQLHYDHLLYMLRFQRDVLDLAIRFSQAGGYKSISQSESISQLPDAARWYEMFVRKYTSVNISPDSIFNYGLRETEKLNKMSQKVGAKVAAHHDWISDTALIHSTYRKVAAQARDNLAAYFPLEILNKYSLRPRPIIPSTKATPHGYYSGPECIRKRFSFLQLQ